MDSVVSGSASEVLLSICVPTYNRSSYASALVQSLCTHILSRPDYSVEVVVSNNASSDDTRERLAAFINPKLKVINRETHSESAEENMIGSIDDLVGEYVWFIGDDDIINISAFDSVYRRLEDGDFDCHIFNSPILTPTGRVRSLSPLKINAEMFEGRIDQIIGSIGLLYTFAGITNIIQRRKYLTSERGRHWIGVSMIYSHVAWVAEANIGRRIAFFNSPLVFYRENDYSDGRWEKAAERRNIPDLFNWTLGIYRLISEMIKCRIISYFQAGLILELAESGQRYRLIDDIIFKTFQQLERWVQTPIPRQLLSSGEMKDLIRFACDCDATMFYPTQILMQGYEVVTSASGHEDRLSSFRDLQSRFLDSFTERQFMGVMVPRFRGRIYDFEVYELPLQMVAIHTGSRDVLYKVLEEIDPVGDGYEVLVGKTLGEISEQAKDAQQRHFDAAREARRQTGVSPELGSIAAGEEMSSSALDNLRAECEALRASAVHVRRELDSVLRSTSWRVSAPVRVFGRLLGRG